MAQVSIACVAMFFRCFAYLWQRLDGRLAFMTPWELLVSSSKHFLFALTLGVCLGSLIAAICAIALLFIRPENRANSARNFVDLWIIAIALILAVLLTSFFLGWLAAVGLAISAPYYWIIIALIFTACLILLIRRSNKRDTFQIAQSILNSTSSRRALLATGAAGIGIAVLDAAVGNPLLPIQGVQPAPPNAPNIILVTFDALAVRDMSLYGARLPTTPFLDAFAQNATVFTNYYSCSTFTTPCVASMLSGRYPSETGLYHLQGQLRGKDRQNNLLSIMSRNGYAVGASVANPYAHPTRLGIDDPFLFAPPPPIRFNHLAGQVVETGDPILFEFAMAQEFKFWQLNQILNPNATQIPPELSFHQASKILAQMPRDKPHFLWIHVFAPHSPYKPQPPYYDRFAQEGVRSPDRSRERYDEFVAECDDALGRFFNELRSKNRLDNTAIIVSADHGESFENGVIGHDGPTQVRQIVNIPLIIHRPNQHGRILTDIVADQTSLAPTILDLAGLKVSSEMKSTSLYPYLDGTPRKGGLAFTQYLANNSIFQRIGTGTVGVVNGHEQYIVDLATGKGTLHAINEANQKNVEHPESDERVSLTLRRAIQDRFPDLLRNDV